MNPVDQAVILLPPRAAGPARSWDLSTKKILGLTLLERAVLASAQSGVRDFVLAGHTGQGWEEATAGLRCDPRVKSMGLRLEFVPISAMGDPGREVEILRPFWLIRGDLVFDPALLADAPDAGRKEDESVHFMDRRPTLSPEDHDGVGLKTDEDGGSALPFVPLPNMGAAAYAGISLCPPGIFPKLAAVLGKWDAAPPDVDAMNGIFGPSGSRTDDTRGRFCFRVLSKTDLKRARRSLLATARKPTDSFISRTFNRPISLFLTRPLIWLGIKPNPLSVVCLAIGMASCWFIAQGGYVNSALGAFLFEFASIFDGCDGEVARLTYRTSKFGGFVDMVGDAVIFVLFFACLPVGLYRSSRRPVWLVLGVLALLSMGTFYLQLTAFMKKKKLGNYVVGLVKDIEQTAGRPGFGGRLDRMAAKIAFIYRRDFFSMGAFIVIAVGGAAVLMWVLGVLIPLQPVYVHFFSKKRFSSIPSPE
ncbi:MAG: CDP-alcohol phosphatidyltransferase family protein [Candidatus Aminicenantales bacterium]